MVRLPAPMILNSISANYDQELINELLQKYMIHMGRMARTATFNHDFMRVLSHVMGLRWHTDSPNPDAIIYPSRLYVGKQTTIALFLKRHFEPSHRIWGIFTIQKTGPQNVWAPGPEQDGVLWCTY